MSASPTGFCDSCGQPQRARLRDVETGAERDATSAEYSALLRTAAEFGAPVVREGGRLLVIASVPDGEFARIADSQRKADAAPVGDWFCGACIDARRVRGCVVCEDYYRADATAERPDLGEFVGRGGGCALCRDCAAEEPTDGYPEGFASFGADDDAATDVAVAGLVADA